jgi:hypothetical protein
MIRCEGGGLVEWFLYGSDPPTELQEIDRSDRLVVVLFKVPVFSHRDWISCGVSALEFGFGIWMSEHTRLIDDTPVVRYMTGGFCIDALSLTTFDEHD